DSDHVAGHGSYQGSLLDGRTRFGEAGDGEQVNGSACRIDVDVVSVAGDGEAAGHPVGVGQHDLVGSGRDHLYRLATAEHQPCSGEPVFDAVFGVVVIAVGLDLIARR